MKVLSGQLRNYYSNCEAAGIRSRLDDIEEELANQYRIMKTMEDDVVWTVGVTRKGEVVCMSGYHGNPNENYKPMVSGNMVSVGCLQWYDFHVMGRCKSAYEIEAIGISNSGRRMS